MTNITKAKQAFPEKPKSNGWDIWDENEEKRKGYLKALNDFDKLPVIKGYIVKHKWGEITFFSTIPVRDEESGTWIVYGACIEMNMAFLFTDSEFKDLKWEDEPIPYNLILRKK